MINSVSNTSFGCGHCRDAANKFIKAGIPETIAKADVARAVGEGEHCYTDAHSDKARKYDFSLDLNPKKFDKRLVALQKKAAKLNVKA